MMPSSLYVGEVYHRRRRPREHRLRYRVFSLLLDIDEIGVLDRRLSVFSHNRGNLVSLYDRDFLMHPEDRSLRDSIHRSLAQAGIDGQADKIMLSCYPRLFGYAFNPLSVFYCLDTGGRVFAIVHEVHNTFGERYRYVLAVAPGRVDDGWIRQQVAKRLFVSPFADTDLDYRFRLNVPGERQVIAIQARDRCGPLISASYTASRRPLDDAHLLRQVLAMPWMTLKVIIGIHVEALRLWLKRVPLFRHQPLSATPGDPS